MFIFRTLSKTALDPITAVVEAIRICNSKCVWAVGVDQGAGRERGATKSPREASDRRCWTTSELLGGWRGVRGDTFESVP